LIILLITGCTNNPPLKSNPNVPKVKELRSLSGRNAIALEWDIVNKPEIAGYYIQRSEDAKKYKTIAKIKSKYVGHFTDTDLIPNKIYYYKISTFTKNGIPSFAKFKKVKTLDKIEPIPFIANGDLKVKGIIKIIFRPHPNERVKGYYIERFNDLKGKWSIIANIKSRLSAEYIDKGLLDGKIYRYRIIAYSWDGLTSYPSKTITIQTLQKPKMITDLNATTSLSKKIKLNWQKIPRVVKYKIYASDNGNSYYLLATTINNSYVDFVSKNGFKRFYRISSVDEYGIESLMSQVVMGSTLPLPAVPIVSIEKNPKNIKFILSSPDKRAVEFVINKLENNKVISRINSVQGNYIDRYILPKHKYTYKIFAIDKNGLISKPAEVEVNF